MQMYSGNSIVFSGQAFLDGGLQNPANLSNYTGLTFYILDQVTGATYNAMSTVNFANGASGSFTVTYNQGILTQKGSYYTTLVGSIPTSTIQNTFYLGSNNRYPYLEID